MLRVGSSRLGADEDGVLNRLLLAARLLLCEALLHQDATRAGLLLRLHAAALEMSSEVDLIVVDVLQILFTPHHVDQQFPGLLRRFITGMLH